MACGVFATGYSLRVALLTPTSVACADSSTAISSSKRRGVFKFGFRLGIGGAEAHEHFIAFGWIHYCWFCSFLRRARSSAAAMMARLRSFSASPAASAGSSACTAAILASALAARRASFSCLSRCRRAARKSWRARAASASAWRQASQPVSLGDGVHDDAVDRAGGDAQVAAGAQRRARRCASAWPRRRWRPPGRPGCTRCSLCTATRRCRPRRAAAPGR